MSKDVSKDKILKARRKQKEKLNKAIEAENIGINKVDKKTIGKKYIEKILPPSLQNKLTKNPIIIGGIAVAVFLFLILGYQQFTKPRLGSIGYALCGNFLELYVTYPQYLRYASSRDFRDDKGNIISRIWFSQLDAFGQNRMERIQCYFRITPENQLYIDRVTIDRREIDRELVRRFNAALDGIKNIELNKELPRDFPSRIQDLKFNLNYGRKPLL